MGLCFGGFSLISAGSWAVDQMVVGSPTPQIRASRSARALAWTFLCPWTADSRYRLSCRSYQPHRHDYQYACSRYDDAPDASFHLDDSGCSIPPLVRITCDHCRPHTPEFRQNLRRQFL